VRSIAGSRERLAVHLDAADLGPARTIAELIRERGGGKSVISFAYEPGWVDDPDSFALDPALPLFPGEQYPAGLPGVLADAAPDRWGRTLIERREALAARREERPRRHLDDWDFLIGVDDRTRMGALRLASDADDGRFLAADSLPVPPLARLRELEHWAQQAEEGVQADTDEEERWLAMLVAPGSSLGGARPKASYLDAGALWLAKFPSREDRHDVGAWEHVLTRLAGRAGIAVPETRLRRLGSAHRTFCAMRFDRAGGGRRHYASAMTLTGHADHENASYLDIARAIVDFGDPEAIEADLSELFRRVVFNVLTAGRDDHLRNHGFLHTGRGWRLSPAFDLNPIPSRQEHALALDDSLRTPDLAIVRETAPYYRLTVDRAEELIDAVSSAIAEWPGLAREAELPAEEIERIGAGIGRG